MKGLWIVCLRVFLDVGILRELRVTTTDLPKKSPLTTKLGWEKQPYENLVHDIVENFLTELSGSQQTTLLEKKNLNIAMVTVS